MMGYNTSTFYIAATSRQLGALGIYHIHAPEEVLEATLDVRIGSKKVEKNFIPLEVNELRYGWLRSNRGNMVDEVMLAKFEDGTRVLMSHGGHAIREQIENDLIENGYRCVDFECNETGVSQCIDKNDLFSLLPFCKTEAQAAAILERLEASPSDEGSHDDIGNLLMTHRLLLSGPPNAGKSSLLNNLAGHERAFVHAEAGATTDVVDELVDLGGYAVLVGDMPGFSLDGGGLGQEAWELAAKRIGLADAVLFVCDASLGWDGATERAAAEIANLLAKEAGRAAATRVLVVLNKSDLPNRVEGEPWRAWFPDAKSIRLSSLPDGDACEKLAAIASALFG